MAENNSNRAARKKPVVVQVSDMGRLQPQARDLEQAVLGALMLEQDAFFKVNETLKPESFYERAHRLIYQEKRRPGGDRRTALHLPADRERGRRSSP